MPGRLPLALLVVAVAACLSDTARYGPERDDAAMATIAATFHDASSGLTLTLCEDVAAGEGWEPGCLVQHVVQGGGRGRTHDEEWPAYGCGGCGFTTVAYVQGTVDGGPFVAPSAVRGEVILGSAHHGDPYALPYSVWVQCEGDVPCRLSGDLRSTGALPLEVTVGGASPVPVTVVRQGGAAACL